MAAGRSIEADTYRWAPNRLMYNATGHYQFYRNWAMFADISSKVVNAVEITGPRTPSHAQLNNRDEYGGVLSFGVKTSF